MGCCKKCAILLFIGSVIISLLVFRPHEVVLRMLPFKSSVTSYHIYLLNNTPKQMKISVTCDVELMTQSDCQEVNGLTLTALQRTELLTLELQRKNNKTLRERTVTIGFTSNAKHESFYFVVRVEVVNRKVKLRNISVFANGKEHVLLGNEHNVISKALSKQRFYMGDSKSPWNAFAVVQGDRSIYKGIDSIYLTVDQSPPSFRYSPSDGHVTLATYNFQAFPKYFGIFKDLNKLDSRVAYLTTSEYIKNLDVIAFQEIWDGNVREMIKSGLRGTFKYSEDPVPTKKHGRLLNSGLLVLSRHPILETFFLNYLDHQSLYYGDMLTNKGALYVKFKKNSRAYNIIVSHTQSGQDNKKVWDIRKNEFNLIREKIIDNRGVNISKLEPIFIMGDLNTNFYNRKEFQSMKNILNLNSEYIEEKFNSNAMYSLDPNVNIMAHGDSDGQSMFDYIVPVGGFLAPSSTQLQIIPMRGFGNRTMYEKSGHEYGNVEISDHFMVQGEFEFS